MPMRFTLDPELTVLHAMAADGEQTGKPSNGSKRSRSRSRSSKSKKSADKEAAKEEKVASTRGDPRVQAPEDLPVLAYRENIIDLLIENRIIVVVGETGSGKTTQIPQYLLDSERFQSLFENKRGLRIAITQPRRVAAVAMARRVSDERGTRLGDVVGYCIRFEDKSGEITISKNLFLFSLGPLGHPRTIMTLPQQPIQNMEKTTTCIFSSKKVPAPGCAT